MSIPNDPRIPAGTGAPEAAPQDDQAQQLPASVRGAVDLGQAASAPADGAQAQPQSGAGQSGGYRRDIETVEQFQAVAEQSASVPVVLVLWAAYSEQSRTFVDQVAEQIDQRAGRLVLGAVDIEKLPQIAEALQAQSVPTTVAMIGGRPVPIGQSAIPDEQLSSLLDELLQLAEQNGVTGTAEPSSGQDEEQAKPLPPLHQEAVDKLEAGDLDGAKASYEQALKENPGDHEAKLALAQVELLRRVTAMDAAAVRQAAAQDQQDIAAQLDVADLDVSGGHVEDAFTRLLQLVRRTAGEQRETVRQRLVELFDVVGSEDPRVVAARGQLMRALF
jgi:putative thioredoxin